MGRFFVNGPKLSFNGPIFCQWPKSLLMGLIFYPSAQVFYLGAEFSSNGPKSNANGPIFLPLAQVMHLFGPMNRRLGP